MTSTTSFNLAFTDWMHNDIDRFDRLWAPPELTAQHVRLSLRRFSPHVFAYLDRSGVNVAVEWDYDTWGHLYARDLVAERDSLGRWRNGIDLEPASDFDRLDELWAARLFVPLVDWLETVLGTAEIVCLSEQRRNRRAALVGRTSPLPAHARYAIVAEPPATE